MSVYVHANGAKCVGKKPPGGSNFDCAGCGEPTTTSRPRRDGRGPSGPHVCSTVSVNSTNARTSSRKFRRRSTRTGSPARRTPLPGRPSATPTPAATSRSV
ncbi:unnamed protein product, partial [Ectocarpus sp. 8 AP-2014]